jgi:hypothetical protein
VAFPTSSVLDNFNRTDSSTLGANWGSFWGNSNFKISSNAANADSSAWFGNYYNVATYGPNCEVFVTAPVHTTTTYDINLRVQSGTLSAPNCYTLEISAGNTWTLYRTTGGSGTVLGATVTQAMGDGDSFGLEAIGSTIKAYYKASGGSWTEKMSRTDSTYSSAGYLAMDRYGDSGGRKYDDFGGGTVSSGLTPITGRLSTTLDSLTLSSSMVSSFQLSKNLTAYWPMNESSGDALDSFSGKTLTLAGTVDSNTGKVYATAREFTALTAEGFSRSNSDVRFGDVDYTVAFWWYEYSVSEGSAPRMYHYILCSDDSVGGYTFGINHASELFFQSGYGGGQVNPIHLAIPGTVLNTWHFGFAQYIASTNTLSLSIDNQAATTQSFADPQTVGNKSVYIGYDGGANNTMDGRIGPLMMWTRALSDVERGSLYNNGSGLTYIQLIGQLSTITGSLSSTLDNTTLVSRGSVSNKGRLSSALDGIALNARGNFTQATNSGRLSSTLDSVSSDQHGKLSVSGRLSSTLDGVTLNADGSLSNTGRLALTLSDVTSDQHGLLANTGRSSSTLDNTALDAHGILSNTGRLSSALDGVSSDQHGLLSNSGRLISALDNALLSARGNLTQATNSGHLSSTLDDVLLDAHGLLGNTGHLSSSLDSVSLVSLGLLGNTGHLSSSLDSTALDAHGVLGNSGRLSSILSDATPDQHGTLSITGQQSSVLGDAILTATGVLTPIQNFGRLSSTLDNAVLNGQGFGAFPVITGHLTSILSDVTLGAQGNHSNSGRMTSTLDDTFLVSQGKLSLFGQSTTTLDSATLDAHGQVGIFGRQTSTLDDTVLIGRGVQSQPSNSGRLSSTLGDSALLSSGKHAITGHLTTTLDDSVVLGRGYLTPLPITGGLSVVLEGSVLNAYGYHGAYQSSWVGAMATVTLDQYDSVVTLDDYRAVISPQVYAAVIV